MKSNLKKLVGISLIFVFLFSTGVGCAQQRKPLSEKMGNEPTISLYVNETGETKRLKAEEYIKGVVAAEMDTDWPPNALAAQAILARTFTMKQIRDKGGVPKYGTDASTSVEEFQAYDPTKINNNVQKAVEMTRGEVVKYNGKYINAWFSACDGGTEASAAEGLAFRKEETPYIKAGVEDGCLAVTVPENKNWSVSFPLATVRSAVKQVTGSDPGEINSGNVAIAKKGLSGRAEVLKIGSASVGGAALRLALGNDKMRSIFLKDISVQGGNLVMKGKGYGHGVGMCQWGAKKMATDGKSPEDIIRFYFQGITIDKIWK